MSLPPPNWYPDPQQPLQLRYWDGSAWTAHVAPGAAPAMAMAPATAKGKGLPGWGIALIVVAAVLIVFGVLAAIAIPVFLNQRDKQADAEARYSVTQVAQGLVAYDNQYGGESPIVTSTQDGTVIITAPDGTAVQSARLDDGVTLGGYVTYNSGEWCVWVSGKHDPWHWDSGDGLARGACP